MFDRIDPRSPIPLYAQIAGRLRVAVASGELRPGDALPSVRALAAQLRINPATVAQAYRELEQDGTVEMRQGAGTFVSAIPTERKRRERAVAARSLVRDMISDAFRLGINADELRQAFDDALDDATLEPRA
ncbi:MAG: GntR family transcriptional regulator [Gemmatimonadaceae bacterium]|nr:GntR family transcriptional regulator [Gemmatimonadaceae bacterium]